jgi:hypothetical protein
LALIPAGLIALALDGATTAELLVVGVVSAAPVVVWRFGMWMAARHEPLAGLGNEETYLQFFFSGSPGVVVTRELNSVATNLAGHASMLSSLLGTRTVIGATTTAVLVLAFAFGAYLLARRARMLVATSLVSLGVIFLWPAYQDRFLISLLPFVGLVAAFGIHRAVQIGVPQRTERRIGLVAICCCEILLLIHQQSLRVTARSRPYESRFGPWVTPSAWIPANARFVHSLAWWTAANTAPSDRIAVASAAGLWLYSGRTTELTEFAEPPGAPSVFEVPGEYLAGLLSDRRVSVVAVESETSAIATDVYVVHRRCPASLVQLPGIPRQSMPMFFRAEPDSTCIGQLLDSLRAVDAGSR